MNIKQETLKHIEQVQTYLTQMIVELNGRAFEHDSSKLESPEVEIFETYTPKLKDTTYGGAEYNRYLKEMKPALNHHYANNRHHPEHFKNGINDMTLVDLMEMLADWKAATLRHADGDMTQSFIHNKKRFKISDQLLRILSNTVDEFLS